MKRQVILLEDLIDVFRQELGHVLEDVDEPGPGRPPVYPAKGLFLCWLFIYLGVADSQRRLVQILTCMHACSAQKILNKQLTRQKKLVKAISKKY
jgi:hypothetical protein